MFEILKKISARPVPYEFYTAKRLWNDPHISKKMLEYHLDGNIDLASRNQYFIKKSVNWIAERFNVTEGTRICDFGCGPGLYTTGFAGLGASVTGIDFSERSIQYAKENAKKRNLNINYILKNYLNYDTNEKFDLLTLIFCDYCALSPQQRANILKLFNKLLDKGASALIDVSSLTAFENKEEVNRCQYRLMDGFWSEGDYYGFQTVFKYQREKIILDKYTVIEKKRMWRVYNWMQYYNMEMLTKEFKDGGFIIKDYYADVSGNPFTKDSPEIAVVIQKSA